MFLNTAAYMLPRASTGEETRTVFLVNIAAHSLVVFGFTWVADTVSNLGSRFLACDRGSWYLFVGTFETLFCNSSN